MRIAIIADALDIELQAGIPTYMRRLIDAILWLDTKNEYVIYTPHPSAFLASYERCERRTMHDLPLAWTRAYRIRKLTALPMDLRRMRIDVVHELNAIGPFLLDMWRPYATVTTLYDLTPLLFRGIHTRATVFNFTMMLGMSLRKSDRIVAISESTRRDALRLYPSLSDERVVVSYPGTDIGTQKTSFSEVSPFDFPYILSVGTIEPRKNLAFLIRSYIALRKTYPIREKLVLVGRAGWRMEEFLAAIEDAGEYRDDIILTGFVSHERLIELYRHACVFVYPSLYEGFGLPVLEAMTLGCPVITTDVSSLPEVVGEGGTMVSPTDVGTLVRTIHTLLIDTDARQTNIDYHTERATAFSWERSAQEYIGIYRAARETFERRNASRKK